MVILGIGSNLSSAFGDRFKNINLAIQYLEQYGFQILKRSAFYETPSYPNKSNPKFINIIIQTQIIEITCGYVCGELFNIDSNLINIK